MWEQQRSLSVWEKVGVPLLPWEADAQGSQLTHLPKPQLNPFPSAQKQSQNPQQSLRRDCTHGENGSFTAPAGTKPCLGWGGVDFSPTSMDLPAGPPYKTLPLRATKPSSDTHSPGGGHFTQVPAPLGNDICCSWKIKGRPWPPARSEPRRTLKSEQETTSSELPTAAVELHRWLSHPRPGAGDVHTGWLGFFFPNTKFKIQVLFPTFPFFEEGFYKPEAKRQVCFCSRFVTSLVETVTSKCKKKKKHNPARARNRLRFWHFPSYSSTTNQKLF